MVANKATKLLITAVLFFSVQVQSSKAQALSKEFITSATYGVLAGTIVGAATLAFTENPGDNLNRIARGASLGLYFGIFLGLYVTYGVSSASSSEFDDASLRKNDFRIKIPEVILLPLTEQGHVTGIAASWNAYSF